MIRRQPLRRGGFTTLELLTVVAVIAVLLALLLPAVAAAREAARRVACQNNVKQHMLAMQQYVDQSGRFPLADRIHLKLLPYLDAAPQYEAIETGHMYPSFDAVAVPSYACPSDADPFGGGEQTNYCVTHGPYQGWNFSGYWVGPANRDSRGYQHLPNFYTDGLDSTVVWSEVLTHPAFGTGAYEQALRDPARFGSWFVPGQYDPHRRADEYVSACETAGTAESDFKPIFTWLRATLDAVTDGYDHGYPPNTRSCWAEPSDSSRPWNGYITRPASSYHPGGVTAGFAGGRVAFITDSIDRNVWRALGTSAAGDLAPF